MILKLQRSMKRAGFLIALLAMFGRLSAQEAITLQIGDQAPAIKYSRWLKGTPVQTFKNEHMYVLEFWATWCGPCIAAMPHLSELAKKYQDKATFIGVNVYEKTGDKPYESSLQAVMQFVNSSGGRMSYDVIADNNAQDMANSWLKPAGIQGIPATFVVYHGKIVWIGHPIKLDNVIEPILNGTFDVAAFKKEYDVEAAAANKLGNDMKEAFKLVQDAVAEKKFDKAFQLIDEGIKKVPILSMSLKLEKFKILLNHFPEKETLDYANQLNKESRSFATMIAVSIVDKDDLSAALYQYAADLLNTEGASSAILDKVALAQCKYGNFKAAIETQMKAVDLAKVELNNPKYAGRVFDYTISAYEEKVKQYQKKLK